MDSPEKCVVLVPVAKRIEEETELFLQSLQRRGYPIRLLKHCSQVDLARSMLASQALRDGFAETMWIDSDVTFDVEDVERLRSHRLPVTAGLYVKKGRKEFAAKFKHAGQVGFGNLGSLVEMQYVGFGFIHVRAEVYRRIAGELKLPACGGSHEPDKKVTPYFIPTVVEEAGEPVYLSEDYSFCHRARSVGFKVMADTTIRLGHVHSHVLTWDDLAPRQTYGALEIGVEDLETNKPGKLT